MAKKKSKEEPESAPDETESAQPAGEEESNEDISAGSLI